MTLGRFEEAYWTAFYEVFGLRSGRTLKALLIAQSTGGGAEWERVHEGLERILGAQARAVLQLASEVRRGDELVATWP